MVWKDGLDFAMRGVHSEFLDPLFQNLNTVTATAGCPFTELTDFGEPLEVINGAS